MSNRSVGQAQCPKYVYIAGRGHSGSTLLTLLLARHPKVAAIGELANLSLQMARDESTRWVGRCSCVERPFECDVWGKVLREIGEEEGVDLEKHPFSWKISDVGMEEEFRHTAFIRVPFVWARNRCWRLLRYLQYLSPAGIKQLFGFYKPQKTWAENRSTLVTKFATVCNVDATIDASKDPLDMLDIFYNATVPVKIIFLTRDCRGNVWSMLKRLAAGERRSERVVSASREWVQVNGRIWRLVSDLPKSNWLHIRYEDMCSHPDETMKSLFEFIGLDSFDVSGVPSGPEGGADHGHTVGGNRIRFSNEKLNIREDRAWREKLTAEELDLIVKIAGPLARDLGYDL